MRRIVPLAKTPISNYLARTLMKSEINEVVAKVEVAERVLVRLTTTAEQVFSGTSEPPEQSWLQTAAERLALSAREARLAIEQGLALPELKSLRAERLRAVEQEWLTSARQLCADLAARLGENSPVIEALYPHRRFEKLERGGATLRGYRAEFALRRSSGYLRRLALDPEYPFLSGLLAPLDQLTDAFAAVSGDSLDEDQADALRLAISDAGKRLARCMRQARLLSEAALVDQPESLMALGFDERKRAARQAPESEPAAELEATGS